MFQMVEITLKKDKPAHQQQLKKLQFPFQNYRSGILDLNLSICLCFESGKSTSANFSTVVKIQ